MSQAADFEIELEILDRYRLQVRVEDECIIILDKLGSYYSESNLNLFKALKQDYPDHGIYYQQISYDVYLRSFRETRSVAPLISQSSFSTQLIFS